MRVHNQLRLPAADTRGAPVTFHCARYPPSVWHAPAVASSAVCKRGFREPSAAPGPAIMATYEDITVAARSKHDIVLKIDHGRRVEWVSVREEPWELRR